VAVNLYKLMAYKDEYEVARLYSDGRFAAQQAGTFSGGRLKIWLSPPLFAPRGADGMPIKIALPGWIVTAVFPVLARLKGLRGTRLDLFGYSHERRAERALITDYEQDLDQMVAGLDAKRLGLALKIAAIPQMIRGFGPIKAKAMAAAKIARGDLWQVWQHDGANKTGA
jgi:indolepyruvate ferredoxin oxidoreductase